jgi:multidrug efflux pump subunit AcrB
VRFQRSFERGFMRFRDVYRIVLTELVMQRKRFVAIFSLLAFGSLLLLTFVGRDFFPGIKSGEIDMHMRSPVGTRLEGASKIAALVNRSVRQILPGKVTNVLDNCGLPASGINEAYNSTGTIGPQDCDITVSLNDEHSPVDDYRFKLRRELPKLYPGTTFTFLPGDITAKILNFGLPAPIDVQIAGRGQEEN